MVFETGSAKLVKTHSDRLLVVAVVLEVAAAVEEVEAEVGRQEAEHIAGRLVVGEE